MGLTAAHPFARLKSRATKDDVNLLEKNFAKSYGKHLVAAIDPLKKFSESAREELRAFTSR